MNIDSRRERYPSAALRRREELDREAVAELAARCRIEYARLLVQKRGDPQSPPEHAGLRRAR